MGPLRHADGPKACLLTGLDRKSSAEGENVAFDPSRTLRSDGAFFHFLSNYQMLGFGIRKGACSGAGSSSLPARPGQTFRFKRAPRKHVILTASAF